MEESLFESGLLNMGGDSAEVNNVGLTSLEHSLLDVGANPYVAQGVFYMLPIHYEGKLFIRQVYILILILNFKLLKYFPGRVAIWILHYCLSSQVYGKWHLQGFHLRGS